MTPREIAGVMTRDVGQTFKTTSYALAVAGVVWKGLPLVLAILAAPARLDALETRVTHFSDRLESKIIADSAYQFRSLCLQEVQAKLRPAFDLTTRCAK